MELNNIIYHLDGKNNHAEMPYKHHYFWIICLVILIILIIGGGYYGYKWYADSPMSMNMKEQLPNNRWNIAIDNYKFKDVEFNRKYTYYPSMNDKDYFFIMYPTTRNSGKIKLLSHNNNGSYICFNVEFRKIKSNQYKVISSKNVRLYNGGRVIETIHTPKGYERSIPWQWKRSLNVHGYKYLKLTKDNN